ncbi:MAG: hypothetical protein ABI321_06915 [Polyangia bacterium]
MRTAVVVPVLVFSVACSGKAFVETPHTALPLIAPHDHAVLATPQLVTITFPGYALTSKVQGFGDFIGGSSWLKTVGSEYGIGAATQVAKVEWPDAAVDGTTDQQLRKLIGQGITAGTLPSPPADSSQLVYTVYWPSNVILDARGQGAGVLCEQAAFHSSGELFTSGYHDSFAAPNGTRVDYAVVGDCSGDIDDITKTASRELIGTFTNPFEVNNSGWLLDVMSTDPWFLDVNSGEVGYMCQNEKPVTESGWTLHRSWSNAAASAATQPCLPSPEGSAYYTVSASPSTTVHAAAGTTVVYTLTGWSSASVAPWDLAMTNPEGSDFTLAGLNPIFGKARIGNGETTTLTLHIPMAASKAQLGGVNVSSGPQQHIWPVAFTIE